MTKRLLGFKSWGGQNEPSSGVALTVGSFDRSPIVVEYTAGPSYPATWTKYGLILIRAGESGISGIIQEAPLYGTRNTLIYVRRSVLGSDPQRVRGYTVLFEPFRWVETGEVSVFWEDDNDAPVFGNFGGGRDV